LRVGDPLVGAAAGCDDTAVRIVAGTRKGHRIAAPPGASTRPTSDRVRENVFNIVAPWVAGAAVLDLFAGSGAMGIEALSRDAERAVFVESAADACRTINANLDHLGLTGAQVLCQPVERFLATETRAFDLIFCDPPYGEPVPAVPPRLLGEDGLLVVETSSRAPEPDLPFPIRTTRRYGAARITLFEHL
jgi:16S rRNA (guanine966-N2)-methyltransferase